MSRSPRSRAQCSQVTEDVSWTIWRLNNNLLNESNTEIRGSETEKQMGEKEVGDTPTNSQRKQRTIKMNMKDIETHRKHKNGNGWTQNNFKKMKWSSREKQ